MHKYSLKLRLFVHKLTINKTSKITNLNKKNILINFPQLQTTFFGLCIFLLLFLLACQLDFMKFHCQLAPACRSAAAADARLGGVRGGGADSAARGCQAGPVSTDYNCAQFICN